MRGNFSKRVSYEGKTVSAVIVPEHRKNGIYYEVNIPGFDRFYMTWSPLGRYDIVTMPDNELPYELILAVSDGIEEMTKKN